MTKPEGSSIAEALRLLGGPWRVVLIRYLADGPKRFTQLRRENPAIPQRALTLALRALQAEGVVSRMVGEGVPPRVDHALTETGAKIVPLLEALGAWREETARGAGSSPNASDGVDEASP